MKKSGTKTGLFLMELVIALLIFAFCAAICVQIFAAARSRARESEAISKGVFAATSAAEIYKAAGGDLVRTGELLGGEITDGALVVGYDEQWNRSDDHIAYTMTVSGTGEKTIRIAIDDVAVAGNEKTVFTMVAKAVNENA